jgi:H(+)-transporting ATP synthase, vacuolar type, subunit D
MPGQIFPTKSNLIQCKRSLSLAKLGYELLDRKRNIMTREMMQLMNSASDIQGSIDATFATAYQALMRANMTIGQHTVSRIAESTPVADDVTLLYRSVMGIEMPSVRLAEQTPSIHYGFDHTNVYLDDAYIKFLKVKQLTAEVAAMENSVYKLAHAIKQSQKRANALSNIVIPKLEGDIRYITACLEEKERDEFTAQKVIKSRSDK